MSKNCKHNRHRRGRPYGQSPGKSWCPMCDCHYGADTWAVNPKRERAKARKQIQEAH